MALNRDLNCILYVYIYIYLYREIHIYIYIFSISYKQGLNLENSEAEADKISFFILCIRSLHLCLPILRHLQSAALYRQFRCWIVLGGQKNAHFHSNTVF